MPSKKQIGPLIIALLLTVYIAYRAVSLSFTHDEALSYQIIKGDVGLSATANHHYLNTWLMQACAVVSEKEWCLRLPNLLGFLLYAFFSIKIMQSFSMYLQVLFFVPILFFNNYLLDFFSLARGYGLSLGCMMGALYFVLENQKELKYHLYALLFAALAVLSNLNIINFFIALVCIILLQITLDKNLNASKKINQALIIMLPTLFFFYFIAKRLLQLKEAGQLYYGTESALDGLDSIVIWSLDLTKLPGNFLSFFRWLILAVWLIAAVLLSISKKEISKLLIGWSILSMVVGGLYLEHLLFGALYPQNRTALFLIPLLAIMSGAVLQSSFEKVHLKPVLPSVFLATLVAIPLLLQFKERSFGAGVSEWTYDAGTKEAAEKIHALHPNKGAEVSCNWLFRPALSYYSQSRGYEFDIMQVDQPDALNAEYIYDFYKEEMDLSLGRIKVLKLNQDQTALYIKN